MKSHSKILGLDYNKMEGGGLEFSDGQKYTAKELRIINSRRLTDEQKRFLHSAKKIFNGEVVDTFEKQKNNTERIIKRRKRIGKGAR